MMPEKHITEPFAIVLDSAGGIKSKDFTDFANSSWIHLDYKSSESRDIITNQIGLDPYIADALCTPVIHQRFFKSDNPAGIFLVLRCMNRKNTTNRNDMASIRIWIDDKRIITLCHNDSQTINNILEKLGSGFGPKNNIECFISITQESFRHISDTTYKIIDKVDNLEEKILKTKDKLAFNSKIAKVRREIIAIHRYMLPQREVFKNFPADIPLTISTKYKNQFRDLFNYINKSIDNLEYSREHVIILKEEMENTINISINNNMYILSLVVAIFTPLTLISGLLGMNLNGIPFADSPYSFGIVCLVIFIIAVVLFMIVKRKRLI